jgi:hypothetical protein
MNEVRMEPLSDREKRKVKSEVQQNFRVAKLTPDPPSIQVNNQNFAVCSFISPWSGTENMEMKDVDAFLAKKRFSKIARMQLMNMMWEKFAIGLKIRGCFKTLDEADAHAKDIIGPSEGIETYSVEMYNYSLVPPNKYVKKDDKIDTVYEDEKCNEFYKKRRMEKEIQRRSFSRRMEIFRENVKKNNEEWQALSEEEKEQLNSKREKQNSEIEGVPIEKILQDEKMQKLMNQDTFSTLRDIAPYLNIDHDRLYESWARLNAEKRAKEKQLELDAIEEIEKQKRLEQ